VPRNAQTKSSRAAAGVASPSIKRLYNLLDEHKKNEPVQPVEGLENTPSININDEIARAQRIKNEDAAQDITLKRETLHRLFWFLRVETVVIFVFAFFQAIRWPAHFQLGEWSFRLLVTATIAQVTAMLYVAVNYLFPKRSERERREDESDGVR
jgi:hypothetical protein